MTPEARCRRREAEGGFFSPKVARETEAVVGAQAPRGRQTRPRRREQTQERATIFDPERGIEDEARDLVVRRQAWQFGIVPLRIDDGYLIAATSRKQLPRAVRFATRVLGMPVQFEIAEDDELSSLLALQYPIRGMDKSIFDGTAFAGLFGRKAA